MHPASFGQLGQVYLPSSASLVSSVIPPGTTPVRTDSQASTPWSWKPFVIGGVLGLIAGMGLMFGIERAGEALEEADAAYKRKRYPGIYS